MGRLIGRVGVVAALLAGGFLGLGHLAATQAATPVFVIFPPSQTVDLSAGTVQVQVQIQNVSNMAAFGFTLRYDPGVLSSPTVQDGPFLGSSGRQVQCQDALVNDPGNGPGTVQYGCGTFGQGAGVSGSGLLATVTFHLAGGADTTIAIEKPSAVDATTYTNALCPNTYDCPTQGGSVHVNGGTSSQQHGISPTPTAVPVDQNPPPTSGGPTGQLPTAVAGGPAPATSPAPGGVVQGGSAAPSRPSAPATGNVQGASGRAGASGRSGTGVGSFGSGPPPGQGGGGGFLPAAIALATGGLVLVSASAAVRARVRARGGH